MNRIKRTVAIWFSVLLTVVGLGCSTWPAAERPARPKPRPPAPSRFEEFDIASKNVAATYHVFVGLPPEYAASPGERYGVYYQLDANYGMEGIRGYVEKQIREGAITPIIVVGVCTVESLKNDTSARARDFVPAAGGAAFAAFIVDELLPRIDGAYRTVAAAEHRCFAGHSLGGLFSLYLMFTRHDVFRYFIAASSAVRMSDYGILNYEEEYARGHRDLPAALYTSMSDAEGALDDQTLLLERLRGRNYQSFNLTAVVFKRFVHEQTAGPSYENGISLFFKK